MTTRWCPKHEREGNAKRRENTDGQQAKDPELEMMARDIKVRAQHRIGELSRDLDMAKTEGKAGNVRLPASGKLKGESLTDAGISTSTALSLSAWLHGAVCAA